MIAGLMILSSSCKNSLEKNDENGFLESITSKNDTPKCDDPEVIETVLSIMNDNKNNIRGTYGNTPFSVKNIDNKTAEIRNILTKSKDNELKSCNCEGTLSLQNNYPELETDVRVIGNVSYFIQKKSEGEIITQINDAGPFDLKRQ